MATVAIIPARYASTRLPGKPLLAETGKPLIQHVVESVRRAGRIDRIVVATDDARIRDAVADFGGEAVMTDPACRSGTDRLAEAAQTLGLADSDVVVNVQGDEPEMSPEVPDALVELLGGDDADIATAAVEISAAEAANPNRVKVVLGRNGRAIYFSRARIPFDRSGDRNVRYLLHLGIYAYRAGFLRTFAALPPSPAEQAEKLEQLRAMEHGYAIAVAVVDAQAAGIDTPADYAAFVERTKRLAD